MMTSLARIVDDAFGKKLPTLVREVRRLERRARKNKQIYLEESSGLVKKHYSREWRRYVNQSTQDCLSAGSLDASIKVMKSLSEEKTPAEALESINGMGITYFMAGCMATTVAYFHPRGEDFKKYWNENYASLKIEE